MSRADPNHPTAADRAADDASLLRTVPRPPRQPSARARELIFRYQGGQKAVLLIGVMFCALGAPFVLVFGWGVPSDLMIGMSSGKTEGKLTSATINTSTEINGENPLVFEYTYEVEGASHSGSSSTIDYSARELPAEASPISVEYCTFRPSSSRMVGTSSATFGYWGLFSLLFPVIGALMTYFAVRSNRREILAFRGGLPEVGRITFAGLDTSTTINRKHPFQIKWSFSPRGRGEFTGSLSNMDHDALNHFSEGDKVVLLYLPGMPKVNTIYLP